MHLWAQDTGAVSLLLDAVAQAVFLATKAKKSFGVAFYQTDSIFEARMK
jgi:hypothetical protein